MLTGKGQRDGPQILVYMGVLFIKVKKPWERTGFAGEAMFAFGLLHVMSQGRS